MNLEEILAFLAPFAPMLKTELLSLDQAALTELNIIIASVSSPDLQALLQAMANGLNSFAQLEINKLP
jgi:hypothetical protein